MTTRQYRCLLFIPLLLMLASCMTIANPLKVNPIIDITAPSAVQCLAFSPDGSILATGCKDGYVRVWNAGDGVARLAKSARRGPVNALTFRPDGTRIAFQTRENLKVWDAETGAELLDVHGRGGEFIESIDYNADGSLLLCGVFTSEYDDAVLIDADDVYRSETTSSPVYYSAPEKKEQTSASGFLRLWDAWNGMVRQTINLFNRTAIVTTYRSSPGASEDTPDVVNDNQSWHTAGAALYEAYSRMANKAVFSPDGTQTAASFNDGAVRVYALNGALLAEFHNRSSASAIAFSPDGKRLAVGFDNGNIVIYNIGERKMRLLQRHYKKITALVYSPDGAFLVSGSADATIRFWNADRGKEEAGTIRNHRKAVTALAYTQDGRRLASADADTVRIWDTAALGLR
ncbi:MAG: WD40 repeat domain-containing protein [Treponema sp.]|jgi:WD40 repeat protein|nr:WD40 repeat domain-containing protein [Treponema sp.]